MYDSAPFPRFKKNKTESNQLFKYCDEALKNVVQLLQIEAVVAVGRFAEKRVKETFKEYNIDNVRVLFLLHPSPRVPGNEDWQDKAIKQLTELDLVKYFKK